MTDTTTGESSAQGASGSQAQGAATQAQGAAADAASASGTGDAAQLAQKIADLEKDNRAYRERERQREEADRKAQEALLTEAERSTRHTKELEEQVTSLTQALRVERVRGSVISGAQRLGFADPADAVSLLDSSALEFDDDGRPKNVERLLSKLLADKPYLASGGVRVSGSAEGGVRGSTTPTDMNLAIRQAAGRA